MIVWLDPGDPFPDVRRARGDGLLAVGGELTPDRVLDAYQRGIFPWYSADEPVLWWSPDPRMVLHTAEFRVSHSLGKRLARLRASAQWQVRTDSAFEAVMRACAAPRAGQDGTWITPEMIAVYVALHRAGFAHSIETWDGDQMIGGLYGIAIGRMFFGESMFARATDASKVALAALVSVLRLEGVAVIDCQQNTAHLASLGAREIPRQAFVAHVVQAARQPAIRWEPYAQRAHLNALLISD